MAKQILKNTANELAVKIVSEVSETITLADGDYSGVVPSGYSILSIRWTISDGYIAIERDSDSLYELSGNGHWNLTGLADYKNSTDTIDIVYYGGETSTEVYTLIIHLSKIA